MSELVKHPENLGVAKLGPGADLPSWVSSGTLMSITATADETSVVCTYKAIPAKAKPEGPFTAYEVQGPLDFALTGILSALLVPLAEAQVSVFVLSTYDTDWLLVSAERFASARAALVAAGHTITGEAPAR